MTQQLFDTNVEMELTVYIGKNRHNNWELIDRANENDVWFHIVDQPSRHVILSLPDQITYKQISKQTLQHCARLCITKKTTALTTIMYTEIRYVIKAKEIGSVYTSHTRNICV